LKNYLEYLFLIIVFYLFKILGLRLSSFLGGVFLGFYGVFSKRNKIAKKNIQRAFPHFKRKKINKIIRNMWFHFGRVLGEYPHLDSIKIKKNKHIIVENSDHLLKPLSEEKNCLFFSAHIGNWELTSHLLTQEGFKIHFIYRAPNNQFVDSLLRKIRTNYGVLLIRKGQEGAKDCLRVLNKKGGNIGMLIDQKMNDGISTDFFGHKAMTASAIAKFALKYKCPIIPAVCIRLRNTRFKISYLKPINYKKIKELGTEENVMNYLNGYVEEWISHTPEQWIWIHNRWTS